MVGVNQLWAQTEEVLMDKMCRHLIERVACHIVLAHNSVKNCRTDVVSVMATPGEVPYESQANGNVLIIHNVAEQMGIHSLKPKQLEAISAFCQGRMCL